MAYGNAVVVGIDGADQGESLLEWAAREAEARGKPLVVCHVCRWRPGQQTALEVGPEQIVNAALDAVRVRHPDQPTTGVIRTGSPARCLLEAADDAAMVVVGGRDIAAFPAMLVGSVAHQVAEQAACPVAVVRSTAAGATDVVVGIDRPPQSSRALEVGLVEARRTGGALIALHALRLPPGTGGAAPNPGVDLDEHRAMAAQSLDDALGDVEARNPDVTIERRVVPGPTATRVLLEAAKSAAVVVVGTRGRSGFLGRIGGSVSQQVIRHAHCPVVVAR